jgi:N-acetyl-1-D-myo-inositol-2-amino-2-deoxy-alpha-D-glucopyranoside deacetylase
MMSAQSAQSAQSARGVPVSVAGALAGGLLAVHAHPDDETLSTGALLATWAAAARPVTVVTCTRGERGEVIGSRYADLSGDPAALAKHRTAELVAALAELGVSDHVFLDEVAADGPWVDSGMVWAAAGQAAIGPDVPSGAFALVDVEVAAERLARVLRNRRPAVVVGYEPGGGYGHPDHVQAHRVMTRAVQLAAVGPDRWDVPCVLWSALDAEELVAGRAACEPGGGLVAPLGEPLPSAAVPPDRVDVRVTVAPVADQVVAALRAHATQVQQVRRVPGTGAALATFALSNAVVQPLLAVECYRVAEGSQADAVRWPVGVRVP